MGVAVIHVVDEQAHATRDFRCDIRLLLAHSKLLAADLTDVPGHDIEITVKCDIPTFAWLMAYIKAGSSGQQPPETSLDNCLQLLLASHYLQMAPVLRASVDFIAHNLLTLSHSAAAQLCSIDGCLLDRLATAVQEETLEALHAANCQQQQQQQQQKHRPQHHHDSSSARPSCSSPEQRQQGARASNGATNSSTTNSNTSCNTSSSSTCMLVEKLYKHRLRALLQQANTTLLRCSACGQLFASASHAKLQCPSAGSSAAAGRAHKLPLHQPDPTWQLQTFLAQQRTGAQRSLQPSQQQQQQQQASAASSWRGLYWLVWGHVVVLYCQRCCSHFPARLLHCCRHHPLPAVFESDSAPGHFPCCGAPAWQPGSSPVAAAAAAAGNLQGCSSRDHDPYMPGAAAEAGSKGVAGAAHGTGKQGGKQGRPAGYDVGRGLQLLRMFAPLITAAALPGDIQGAGQQQHHQQQQQQEQVQGGNLCRPVSQGQQQRQQQAATPTLPLLVKMVKQGAGAAGPAAVATGPRSPAGAAGTCSSSASRGGSNSPRPASVQHLPPISSPRQPQEAEQGSRARDDGSSRGPKKQAQAQQQEFNLAAAAAAAVAAASKAGAGHVSSLQCSASPRASQLAPAATDAKGSNSGRSSSSSSCSSRSSSSDADDDDGTASNSSRSSSRGSLAAGGEGRDEYNSRSGGSSSSGRSRTSAREGSGGQQPGDSQAGAAWEGDGCEELDELTLSGPGLHATPLSSVMGAVRAAAEARTKGTRLGSSSSGGGGTAGSGAAGLLAPQTSAPLAETFSAGGRRVLSPTRRKALGQQHLPQAHTSRPSTAASLLSLKQQQQQQQSRPGTGGSLGLAGSSQGGPANAAAAVDRESGDGVTGGLACIGATFNRTLLLELVQQDDAYRMGVLMRKLDSMRLQPPPDCLTTTSRQQQQQQQQQLSQVDVMRAVNGVVFASKYM